MQVQIFFYNNDKLWYNCWLKLRHNVWSLVNYSLSPGIVNLCFNLCSEPTVCRVTTGVVNLCSEPTVCQVTTGVVNLCSEPTVCRVTIGIVNLCLNLCSVNQIATGVVKFCNIAKDIEGITPGVSFKFNFLISCICHACDSGLFTYFLGGLSLHLNHLIASSAANYDWPFGTLPFGLWLKFGHKGPWDIS